VIFTDLAEGVSGLLITKPEMSCIAVRNQDVKERKRFTIAHEIAHFYLKHQFEPGEHVHVDRGHLISQRNHRSATGMDAKEIEANQFAACLLMPADLLLASVKQLTRSEHLYDIHITALSEKFVVSEQAMTIRLGKIGLL
jgi:Zn-dependent peptidase ImmA (M78 family)